MDEGSGAETPGLTLRFDRGTLLLEGLDRELSAGDTRHEPSLLPPPWQWDPRVEAWRAPAATYRTLFSTLHRKKVSFRDLARAYEVLELEHLSPRPPHHFQEEALVAWKKHGQRGIVILPTGSGKSYVAELAIARLGRSTLVVAPTIDLMNQWHDGLCAAFGIEVGQLGGGFHEIRPITVTTYDSAYLHLDSLGNRFALLVFDECHHLPSPSYAQSAEWAIAPFRLGLTATLERADGSHSALHSILGPVVYRQEIKELAGEFLSDYRVERLEVELSADEETQYHEAREIYREFLWSRHISMAQPDGFRLFIMQAAQSDDGRAALQAYRTSRKIALAAPAKLELLERLLLRHRRDRVIIFTHENAMVHQISRQFFIPAITHHTSTAERKEILQRLREGSYPAVATSRVLNEGVNLPEVNIGIVLSGSGSVREHVQRLGRLLRRREEKEAILYEIVTLRTLEERVSERRRNHSAYR